MLPLCFPLTCQDIYSMTTRSFFRLSPSTDRSPAKLGFTSPKILYLPFKLASSCWQPVCYARHKNARAKLSRGRTSIHFPPLRAGHHCEKKVLYALDLCHNQKNTQAFLALCFQIPWSQYIPYLIRSRKSSPVNPIRKSSPMIITARGTSSGG